MPRFYFSIFNCTACPDFDGVDLADAMTARQEGLRFVGSLLAEEPMRQALGDAWALEVTDAAHNLVLRLDVTQPG